MAPEMENEGHETKSTHITFTLRKGQCPPVCINQTVVPQVEVPGIALRP